MAKKRKETAFKINNLVLVLLFLLSTVSLFFNFRFYSKMRQLNKVEEVVDGDTFQLASGKRVRLIGVDAPEFDRCGGPQARDRLKELIEEKIIDLDEETTESYGRTLALVYVDGLLVNEVMLEEGWGRTDYRRNKHRDRLTAAFHQGQEAKLGIFGSLCRTQQVPEEQLGKNCVIKGNIDKSTYEKFYHLPGCKHYAYTIVEKDIGERFFCSEEEASAAGFKKASGCP